MNRFRVHVALTAVAALCVLAGAAGCGAGSGPASLGSAASSQQTSSNAAGMSNPDLDLGTSLGSRSAPAFRLMNQFVQPMSLSQFRGKVVMLSFEDSQCTTVCPLTTQSMLEAKQLLGAAGEKVQLLGVDANPDATSVADVLAYSRAHGMVNQWDFLTGPLSQLKAAWGAYNIAVQIEKGQIDHTPALFVIDQQGRERKLYLTQMAYSSIGQSAQVLADEVASQQSLASISGQGPTDHLTLPSAESAGGTIALGPGKPRLVVFFVTWLSEVSDLKSELISANAYAAAARRDGLPQLAAVDETVVEPSAQTVRSYLQNLGTSLSYPVALDTTGRVADGYGVQDQPWFTLVSASGQVLWSHDGWLAPSALEAAAKHAVRT